MYIDPGTFDWISKTIPIAGWIGFGIFCYNISRSVSKAVQKWETVEKNTSDTLTIANSLKTDIAIMSGNHLSHIESDMRDLNQKHDKHMEVLQSIDKHMAVVAAIQVNRKE
jgi:hypothetical protein